MIFYSIIKKFPADERFALTDQLKRAANSVVHNLAEGYGRYESKDKTRFYKISRGSAFESMSQILVAESQNYLSTETSENIIERYKKVIEEINALIHHLENNQLCICLMLQGLYTMKYHVPSSMPLPKNVINMLYYEIGSINHELNAEDLKKGLFEALDKIGKKQKVLLPSPLIIPAYPVVPVNLLNSHGSTLVAL